MSKIWGKVLCTWCESEAITTIVQMPACQDHSNEYSYRRKSNEQWLTIEHDFWRRRWGMVPTDESTRDH